jgi:hypothetical protein
MLKIDDNIIHKMIEEDTVDIEYVEKPKEKDVKEDVKEEIKTPVGWKPNIADEPLKECEAKFGRFKELCLKIDDKNEWVIYFCKEVGMTKFLYTIKYRLIQNQNVGIEDIYKELLETTKLTDEIVGNGVRDMIKRYTTYFLTVVRSMD